MDSMSEWLISNEIPTNVKPVKGTRTLQSYTEEINKMKIADILMLHRTPVIFDIIQQTYEETMNAYESIKYNVVINC